MAFLERFRKKTEPEKKRESKQETEEWKPFRDLDHWIPSSFKPVKYQPAEWSKFEAVDDWEPEGCTRDNPYKPSPMPLGFYNPYKRPMRFPWDEIPDDYHQIREVGSAERIYASQKTYHTGYSSEAPGAGVLRYKRD